MQYVDEFAASRLSAFAEAEMRRELELRRVTAERREHDAVDRRAHEAADRRKHDTAESETVTVESILRASRTGSDDRGDLVSRSASADSAAHRELDSLRR